MIPPRHRYGPWHGTCQHSQCLGPHKRLQRRMVAAEPATGPVRVPNIEVEGP